MAATVDEELEGAPLAWLNGFDLPLDDEEEEEDDDEEAELLPPPPPPLALCAS